METIPPNAPLEQAIIGLALAHPLTVLPFIDPEFFADGRFELIASAVLAVTEAGEICAPPTVESYLAAHNQLFDGAQELVKHLFIENATCSPDLAEACAKDYAAKLRVLHARRRRIEGAEMLQRAELSGDSEAAADAVRIITDAKDTGGIEQLLASRRFDPHYTPQLLRAVFSCASVPICTADNLTTISAGSKVGKSAIVGGMMAAAMATAGCDTIGFTSENSDGRAILHFDTEQSKDFHAENIQRALRRANREVCPEWLISYFVSGFTVKQIQEALWVEAERQAKIFGGLHSIFIDGVADAVNDVNDPEESNVWVARLHGLAIEYHCPIVTVIHLNPNSENKTRGHLGSQLERKSETNLKLEKDGEITQIWSDKQRRAPILKGKGPRFAWSNEAGMHVSVELGQSPKELEHRAQAVELRDEVFSGRPSMRRGEMEKAVGVTTGKSPRTSSRIVSDWATLGIIERSIAGLWTPTR